MEYDEAMSRYGSDRPDLRFAMELHDMTDLGHTTDFKVFQEAPMVKAIVVPGGGEAEPQGNRRAGGVGEGIRSQGIGSHEGDRERLRYRRRQISAAGCRKDDRTQCGAKDGDLLCFAADKPKIVHKVLGELRLKMARDMKMTPSTEFAWVWVVNFPLFEYDEEEKRFVSTHHPFTAPLDEDLAKLDSDDRAAVESVKSKAYDIVVNGAEVGGGSIRIHRTEVQPKVFALLGIDEAAQKGKFGFLLDALQYGAPPHGGIAPGARPAHDDPARNPPTSAT